MIYIIGSGPAGIASAYALVKKGVKVTMLDAGIELEPEISDVVKQLQSSERWDPKLIKKIKANMKASVKGVERKYSYGSNYPYGGVNKHMPITYKDVGCHPSFAKGGLSSVWGAAVMPYRSEDIEDWPVSINELGKHYKVVLEFMNIGAEKDDLTKLFPIYTNHYQKFHKSAQASLLLKDLNKHKKRLNKNGFIFGSSRLAIQFLPTKDKHGCVYCGLCMHGCPYELIYNTAFTLEKLKKHKNFHYIKDIVVDKLEESKNKVNIRAHGRLNSKKQTFQGSRVFLGCGAISTTKIMLESMNMYDKEIILKDSQLFLMSFLRIKGAGDVTKESLHALAQIYLEILDKKIDPHSIHIQLYTYSDIYDKTLQGLFGPLFNILKKPLKFLMSRIIVAQCYLHSDSSSSISAKLHSNNLVLEKRENKKTAKVIKSVLGKLTKNWNYFKMIPLFPLLKIGQPGEGYHHGGSFPMRKNPKRFESDSLGRPYGFKKIHIVDSSVFPSLAAQTIVFTIMANSHRIASNYDKVK